MPPKHTILALDDNELTLRNYQRCFEAAGHRIILSNTSNQAIDLVQQHRPQLALVDIHLSNQDSKDGYTVCRELQSGQHPAPAVFLVTAHARNASDRLRAFEAGAVAFYDKFVPPLRLLEDVNFLLRTPVPFFQLKGRIAALAQITSGPAAPHAPLRVVIIDDDRDQIEAISMSLEAEGIEPYPAHSARQGIILSYRVSPDVIILDMDLPDMSGSETLSTLKALAATKNIPVIIWTGSEKRGQELICMRDGAAQYLIKGIHEIPAIPLHVRACLRGHPHRIAAPLDRSPSPKQANAAIRVNGFEINPSSHIITIDGEEIGDLTTKLFSLAYLLVMSRPRILDRDEILKGLRIPHVLDNEVNVLMHLLRQRLGSKGKRFFKTIRSRGYQFDAVGLE